MLDKFGICTSLLDMEPQGDKALTPHLELPISEFHACINAIQQYVHQSHDWEQTQVQSPILAKFFSWFFQDLSTLKDFHWIVSMVKYNLKENRSPGIVACAVIL